MKADRTGHIAAILLAGLMLVQAVFVLIPVQDEVLCVAEDHIAIEIPDRWGPVHQDRNGNSGLFSLRDFHTTEDGSCVDIPLQTRTLIPATGNVRIPLSYPVLFIEKEQILSADKKIPASLLTYPPGLFFVRSDRHAERSRVLLI